MKFEKCTSTTDEKSHRLIILLCYTSQESPSLKRQFFKRFNKNLIMLISILVLIETSLKGNGCNLTNSDRNHRNVSGILHSNSASKTDIGNTNQCPCPKICIKKLTKNQIGRCFYRIIFSLRSFC